MKAFTDVELREHIALVIRGMYDTMNNSHFSVKGYTFTINKRIDCVCAPKNTIIVVTNRKNDIFNTPDLVLSFYDGSTTEYYGYCIIDDIAFYEPDVRCYVLKALIDIYINKEDKRSSFVIFDDEMPDAAYMKAVLERDGYGDFIYASNVKVGDTISVNETNTTFVWRTAVYESLLALLLIGKKITSTQYRTLKGPMMNTILKNPLMVNHLMMYYSLVLIENGFTIAKEEDADESN